MKKVSRLLSLFSYAQEWRDPFANFVRARNKDQVAKWKTEESGFSLKDKEQIPAVF